jgi:hypothetical protein
LPCAADGVAGGFAFELELSIGAEETDAGCQTTSPTARPKKMGARDLMTLDAPK